MAASKSPKYLVLAGLAGLFIGCVGSDNAATDDGTEEAYALRSELSGSADSKKTYVCHIPPGNPANAHTIHVGNPAVDAHLAHGDSLGQCDSVLTPVDGPKNCKGKGPKGKKSIQDVVKKDGQGWKVTICHLPPGNPENAHTLSVGAPAVRAHLAHGDKLGACVVEDDTASAPLPDCVDTGKPDDGSDTTTPGGGDTTGGNPGGGTDTGTTGGGTDTGTPGGGGTVVDVPADNT